MEQNTTTQLVQQDLNPSDLLVDVNVRLDSRVDKDFVHSIRENGVLQPVIAVQTAEGQVRVRFGHRRTLAAVEAGLTTIPVIIAGTEGDSDAEQIERIIQQHAENQHRTGLTHAEHANVVAQLTAFGLSPTQITKRTRIPKAQVAAARTVAGSDLAKQATVKYDLTLDQAATVAEFEADTETVKALVVAARTGQFEHVAQRARDDRAEAEQIAQAAATLTEQGITVIPEADVATWPGAPGTAAPLTRLTNEAGTWDTIEEDEHTDCPGHAAYITSRYHWDDEDDEDQDEQDDDSDDDEDGDTVIGGQQPIRTIRYEPVWVCTDPTAHGHHHRGAGTDTPAKKRADDMTEEEREEARAARREVIHNNKAWESATTVRIDWLRTYLARKSAPKFTAQFLAETAVTDPELLTRPGANGLAAELFGAEPATYGRSAHLLELVENATDTRATVLHLGIVLAAYEASASRDDWRHHSPATSRYLHHLAKLGYPLSDVEERATTTETA